MKDEGRPDDGEAWFIEQVEQHFDTLNDHVRLVYPLSDADGVILDAFGQLREAGPAPTTDVDVSLWLFRVVRELAFRHEDDVELARRRNCDAVLMSLQDVAEQAGVSGVPAVEVAALSRLPLDAQELLRLASVEELTLDDLAYVVDTDAEDASFRLKVATDRLREVCAVLVAERGGGEVTDADPS